VNKMSSWALVAVAALAASAAGCGNTVKSVCTDLDDACPELPYSECLRDGDALEQAAQEQGCSDAFGDYLDCAAGALSCNWDACSQQRTTLEACVGQFPK
jgi:predicted small secreted protein